MSFAKDTDKSRPPLKVNSSPEQPSDNQSHNDLWTAIIHIGDHEFDCQVKDLSQGVLKLKLNLPFKIGTFVRLEVPACNLNLEAAVSWQDGRVLGLSFLDSADIV